MRNIKLVLTYDGSPFKGWQIQPSVATVQGTLIEALYKITGERGMIHGSGRTDAGVHALGQVANFQTESKIPIANFCKAINANLPACIRALRAEEVAEDFHARRCAKAKTYEYRIFRGEICPPFLRNYVTHHPFPLREEEMMGAAKAVVGEHDFTSFAAVDPEKHSDGDADNVREVFDSSWERRGEEFVYTVRGSGFLHHMVRNLVGTFLLVGRGTLKSKDVSRIMAAKDRTAAGATAPAEGLYLVSVEY